MLLNSLLASLLNALVCSLFKSVNSLGPNTQRSSVQLLDAEWEPIDWDSAQPYLKSHKWLPQPTWLPSSRQVLMKDSLTEVLDQSQLPARLWEAPRYPYQIAKALDKPRNILYSWSSAHGSSLFWLGQNYCWIDGWASSEESRRPRFELNLKDAQISSQDPLVVVKADQLVGWGQRSCH